MSLRAQILAIIEPSPGISLGDLKARLPDLSATQISNALFDLMTAGKIESAGFARYRLPEPRRPTTAGRGQTAPLARLMAGR